MTEAFLLPKTRDLPLLEMGDLALDFKDLLLGDLAGFFAVFEGVVLR